MTSTTSTRCGAGRRRPTAPCTSPTSTTSPPRGQQRRRTGCGADDRRRAGRFRPSVADRGRPAGFGLGRPVAETDVNPAVGPDSARGGAERLALDFAERGVRRLVARFAPTVHGAGTTGSWPPSSPRPELAALRGTWGTAVTAGPPCTSPTPPGRPPRGGGGTGGQRPARRRGGGCPHPGRRRRHRPRPRPARGLRRPGAGRRGTRLDRVLLRAGRLRHERPHPPLLGGNRPARPSPTTSRGSYFA